MALKLPALSQKTILYSAVGIGAIIGLSIYTKGAKGFAASITSTGVGFAAGAAEGVIVGVGAIAGVPKTNPSQCAIDMAHGDNWAASFSCDASTFAAWQAEGVKTNLRSLKAILGF